MKYTIMNNTDGIMASPDIFSSIKKAKEFIINFPKRFEFQGYYLTNKRQRINPEEVEISILDDTGKEIYNNQYGDYK